MSPLKLLRPQPIPILFVIVNESCSMCTRAMQLGQVMAVAVWLSTAVAFGQGFGVESHNTLMPVSGAMGGASIARPQDMLSGVNGNPATLAQFSGTQFTFAGAWVEPTFNMQQTAPIALLGVDPFEGKSTAPGIPMGNIGVSQDLAALDIPATLGVAFITAGAGGADFRHIPASNGTSAAMQIFELTNALSYQLTDRWSIGAGMSLGIALFDGPFVGVGGLTPGYALRGVTGINCQLNDATSLGCYYQSKQAFNFDNAIRFSAGPITSFQDVRMDLPQNVGLGVANTRLLEGRLLLAMDVVFKNWDDAALFRSIYVNQWILQLGAQYTAGRLRYRAGYVFAQDPVDPSPLGDLGGIVPPGGPAALRYTQALMAVSSQHRISGGMGIQNFMLDNLDLDVMAGGMFRDSEQLGPSTSTAIASYWIAAGMTWRFP